VIRLDPAGHKAFAMKCKLEQAYHDKAGHHFTQASNTPLILSPLIHLFGETRKGSPKLQASAGGNFSSANGV